jgi:outer membrane receptor protein involved in Fe transport
MYLRQAIQLSVVLSLLSCIQLPAQVTPEAAAGCEIGGKVHSGNIPLPGVAISAANTLTGKKLSTSTDVDGSYSLLIPGYGRYVVRAELAAFSPVTSEVRIDAATCRPRVDLEMMLLSRAKAAAQEQESEATEQMAEVASERGFQNLLLSGDSSASTRDAENGLAGGTAGDVPLPGMPLPGTNPNAPTESVAISGNTVPSGEMGWGREELQNRMQEMRERAQRGEGDGRPEPMPGGPGGGPGPGGGGPGGGGGPMIFPGGRGGGRFNINRPHGAVFYTLADSALDAAPYSLTGQPASKPGYVQNRFGAVLGGPLKIPKLYNGESKTFFFVSYFGVRAENPYDAFSTVPTLDERAGDFSASRILTGPNAGAPVQIFDPQTQLPFVGNQIPNERIDPAAVGLLRFIPLPNQPDEVQNFHYVTSASDNNDNISLRVTHNFGASSSTPGGGGRMGGPRNNLNFGLQYRRAKSTHTNPFPSVGGESSVTGWNVPIAYVRGKAKFTNMVRFNFNRSRVAARNLYAFGENITGELGITGVSQDPFDWGLPNLSFTNFSGVRDVTPLLRRDQTVQISDTLIWRRGRHTWRWGGDFRRLQLNTKTDTNARGSFTFTGFFTSELINGTPVPGTGLDFADFLLGLPQQTSAQFGANSYYFRGNSWDVFMQDEWKVTGNLTLNLGLRYEYVSPFREKNNRLVNLDAAPGFSAVAAVLPGQSGPFTGVFPVMLVEPDRNNFAPRVGVAWKPFAKTVVRAGYGINYNTGQYSSIAQQLAFQPPFSFTQTNVASAGTPLTLESGFPVVAPTTTTNNFGVDRDYRLGYVQLWNLNIQREIRSDLVLNVDYSGSKGTRLDILRAPNRGPSGLRIPGVQPFQWESSEGSSILHSGTLRLRKRLTHGVSVGGSYTFSKSIDNASSIGSGAAVVAQNDLDLAAERGLSSFDQRHRLAADYILQFPFGPNKRWLAGNGAGGKILGNWLWSGSFSFNSGVPFTARVLGDFSDINRGTNGTLRADVTGLPVRLDNPTVTEFFNTAAFTVPPQGQFGDAGRNTIPGPHTVNFNMAMTKNIAFGDTKALEFRLQASNIFNTPQFTAIDTTVNSRSYGRVIAAGSTRRVQLVARFRF